MAAEAVSGANGTRGGHLARRCLRKVPHLEAEDIAALAALAEQAEKIAFWKDRFAKTHPDTGTFQAGGFHHRLRDGQNYAQKWQSVRENPVRAGLVTRPEDWPYSGRVHEIRWSGD